MAAEKQAELERMKSYSEKVDVILKDMVKALFESQPDDPLEVPFLVELFVSSVMFLCVCVSLDSSWLST